MAEVYIVQLVSLRERMASKMRYALADEFQIIPEWKYCYYDYEKLSALVQILEICSFYSNHLRKRIIDPHYTSKRAVYGRKMLQIEQIMSYCNRIFFYYRECEARVIHLFAQMKLLEFTSKFIRYREMCNVLIADPHPSHIQLNQDFITLLENLYIQSIYLEKMVTYNTRKQQKILQGHKILVGQYGQLDAPNIDFRKLKRYLQMLRSQKQKIMVLATQKDLYATQEEAKQELKTFNQFVQESVGKPSQWKITLFGFWSGTIVTMIAVIVSIIKALNITTQNNTNFKTSFPIWRGLSYFILYFWVIGVGLMVLETNTINYRLLFTLDANHVPHSKNVLIVAALSSTIYLVGFCLYLLSLTPQFIFYSQTIYNFQDMPGHLCLLLLGVWFVPLPLFFWRSRVFLMRLLILTVLSPVLGIDFKYHWLGQQFISFKQPVHDMVYTISYYTHDPQANKTALQVGTYIAIGVFCLRMCQGFRSAYQLGSYWGTVWPRQTLKGILGILTIVAAFIYNYNQNDLMLSLWILSAITSTLYTYHFDVNVDWGLFNWGAQHKLLRKNLVFRPATYYFFIVINLLLRMAWTFTLSNGFVESLPFPRYIFVLIVAYVEILRRGIWSVFRVQFEHVLRCEKFNAVVDDKPVERRVYDLYSKKLTSKGIKPSDFDVAQTNKRNQSQLEIVVQAIDKTQENRKSIKKFLVQSKSKLEAIQQFAKDEKIIQDISYN